MLFITILYHNNFPKDISMKQIDMALFKMGPLDILFQYVNLRYKNKRRYSSLEKPNFKIGMTSAEVLFEIIRVNLEEPHFLRGQFIRFHNYITRENTRDRKVNFLSQLLFHDYSKLSMIGVHGRDITLDWLNACPPRSKKDPTLGVISEVRIAFSFTDYRSYHIPMMDFNCPKSPKNLSQIEKLLRTIGQEEGVILDAGRSYHYYGVNLMDEKEWLNFLANCFLSGLADERYIGHRLKDHCGILRISATPLRPKVPTVVSIM